MPKILKFDEQARKSLFGGADAGNIVTRATRDGDYWVLNGEKTSITFTGVSKVVFVSARTGGPGTYRWLQDVAAGLVRPRGIVQATPPAPAFPDIVEPIDYLSADGGGLGL